MVKGRYRGQKKGPNAHNLYGQIAGEIGSIGIVGFALLLFQIIKTHWKNLTKAKLLILNEKIHNQEIKYMGQFIYFLAICSIQLTLLLLFNGWGGHNLYRYQWLWIVAFGIISSNLMTQFYESKKEN